MASLPRGQRWHVRQKTILVDRETLAYRPCVGIFLLNAEKKIWIGKRDEKTLFDAHLYDSKHLWQLPQGGIDAGESPRHAYQRELYEETGIQQFEIIQEYPDWLYYDLPDHLIGKALGEQFRGQKQKWFAARFLGKDEDIDLTKHSPPEFTHWRWIEQEELTELAVPFKVEVYKKVLTAFRKC